LYVRAVAETESAEANRPNKRKRNRIMKVIEEIRRQEETGFLLRASICDLFLLVCAGSTSLKERL
jgi:hypothetical protein